METWTHIPAFLASRAHLSARTIAAYRDHLTMCSRASADPATLTAALHAHGYSPHTVASLIRDARIYLRWCVARGLLPPNTPIPPMPRTPAPIPRAATEDDWHKLYAIANDRDRLILLLLRDTGARLSALSRLRWDDLDLERQRATVIEKGGRRAVLFLSDRLTSVLRAYPRAGETVLHLSPSGIRQALRRLARRAGVRGRINPHAWRHAFVRDLLLRGCDLSRVSRIINHSRIEITSRYYALWTVEDLDTAYRRYWQMNGTERAPSVSAGAESEHPRNGSDPARVIQADEHPTPVAPRADHAPASEPRERRRRETRLTRGRVDREPAPIIPNGTSGRDIVPSDLDREHTLYG